MIQGRLKNWGSSLGIIVQREIVVRERLKAGEEVLFEVKKRHAIRKLFGSLKGWKIDSQKVKDELRDEWEL